MSPAPRLRVRPAEPADRPRLVELFAGRFGHPISAEVWQWKYERSPGVSASWVAETPSADIVAHAGALGFTARWASGEGRIWQLVDFMGTSGGGGLRAPLVEVGRRLLADLARPGSAEWIFGFPSERHYRLGERVFGYRLLPALPVLEGRLPPAAGPGSGVEVSDSCGDWVEATWEACGVWGVRRTAAFLNWRYHARPDRYYRFFRLEGEAGVDGLAVFAFAETTASAAELWLPGGSDWGAGLLGVAADLRATGMTAWRFWPPAGPTATGLLSGLGVEPNGETRFMGCCGQPGTDPERAAASFYYSMGDYDAV